MKQFLRLIALLLAMLMLGGCSFREALLEAILEEFENRTPVGQAYELLTYVHPDMEEHDRVLEESCDIARTETNIDKVMDAVYTYYDVYDLIYAAYDISYIHYCGDLTDTYWSEEYSYCAGIISDVDDGLDALYYALAASPILSQLEGDDYFGDGFFDEYQGYGGEAPKEDPKLTKLLETETELIDRYYTIYEEAEGQNYTDQWYDTYEPQLGQIFVELIAVRQQIAEYYGYDSYPEFAYDIYHYRDYTPGQAGVYLRSIGTQLVDVYKAVNDSDVWELGWESSNQTQTFLYVRSTAQAMGGDIKKGFDFLEDNELYDISPGENKFPISFESYIYYYYVPYIFLCPDGSVYDKLGFAHEFGHFMADYVCDGSYVGTDVAEVQSQSMEYLSLFYGTDTESLRKLKLADSLCTYVEQAAYALFEQEVYGLKGSELTLDNVRALYKKIGTEFGFDSLDWDPRDYVTIPHYYEQPMYIISYVVSNDVAMQIYELEAEKTGDGLSVYKDMLYSDETYILTFCKEYGLKSPFDSSRLPQVRKTFLEILDET